MLSVRIHQSTGTITLENTQRCNALSRNLIEQLKEALDDLRQERKVRGIVIAGAGAHFCSGLDMKELKESAESEEAMQEWFHLAQAAQSLLEQILQSPKPIIAAVDGAALGTGFGLVLACDLVVASHRAEFAVPATKLGLVSGLVAPLLQFRGGASTAARMMIGGQQLGAAELKGLNLVHHVVEPEQVWVRASTWVDEMSESAAEAIQLTKRVLNEMVGENLSTLFASGGAAMATSLTTEAATEGLKAFSEHRKPQFP